MTNIVLYPSGGGSNPLAGSVIWMDATEVTYALNASVDTAQTPGKYAGSSWNSRLPKTKYLGVEIPTITMAGVIDAKNLSYATNPDSSGRLHQTGSMLRGIIAAGSICLFDDWAIPNSPIYVNAKGIRITHSATSQAEGSVGYVLDYSMDFEEVQI